MPSGFIVEMLKKDLSLTTEDVDQIILNNRKIYRKFFIKKRSGGVRLIHSPSPEAKLIQTWLSRSFFELLDRSNNVYAFRPECSILKNAEAHRNSLFILKFDIKDFFTSIKFSHFMNFLNHNKAQFNIDVQKDFNSLESLVKIFCFLRDETLAQGFSSSPVISNAFMGYYDSQIEMGLKKISSDCIFTRYADDISISFNSIGSKKLIEEYIKSFFEATSCPFELNHSKTRFGKLKSGSMFVNGIKVCNDGRLTIHRKYKDKIRRLFYSYERKMLSIADKKTLLGHLYYLRSVDSKYYNKVFKLNFLLIKNLRAELAILGKASYL